MTVEESSAGTKVRMTPSSVLSKESTDEVEPSISIVEPPISPVSLSLSVEVKAWWF